MNIERLLLCLIPVVLQLDELHTRVRSMTKPRWLWLAIDPISKLIPALHLGGRTNQDAYSLLHHLTLSLKPGWTPLFLSDGLRVYFYAITAHCCLGVATGLKTHTTWPESGGILTFCRQFSRFFTQILRQYPSMNYQRFPI